MFRRMRRRLQLRGVLSRFASEISDVQEITSINLLSSDNDCLDEFDSQLIYFSNSIGFAIEGKFQNLLAFLLEHREEIIALIKSIISMFSMKFNQHELESVGLVV
jgi:hypothetical protein